MESKKEFQELLRSILTPLGKYYTKGGAGLNIGSTGACYPEKTIRMEAFSRPLWGLVPYWAGGGQEDGFAELYRKGLKNGTDPEHSEYWGNTHDCDQMFVEMAAVSYAMLFAPDKIWKPLDEKTKENIAVWLNEINRHEVADNNWQFFKILTNIALMKCGMEYSPENLQKCLDRVEDFYLGDGWYQDGITAQKDYYISFAIHFYSLIYSVTMEKEDKERCRTYRDRAEKFAGQFIYWFSEDGPAIPYGRSLTYRFAQAAFWSMAVVAGIDTVSVPVMKGIMVRHLEYWMSQPIFDKAGLLTIGYAYPNLHMAESYNAPGSPYWALKIFAFLMLPDDHEFWKVTAAPLPELESVKTLKYGEMVIQRRKHDVVGYVPGVYRHNGQVHVPEKYSKFAYSSYFGFRVPRSGKLLTEAVPDSMLAFEISGNIFVRRMIKSFRIENNVITSVWSPFQGIIVETMLIPVETGHIRRHQVYSEIECVAYDCGFAVSSRSRKFISKAEGAMSCVENSESFCRVTGKNGGEGITVWGEPNTNLVTQNTEIPAVKYLIQKGKMQLETVIETGINIGKKYVELRMEL